MAQPLLAAQRAAAIHAPAHRWSGARLFAASVAVDSAATNDVAVGITCVLRTADPNTVLFQHRFDDSDPCCVDDVHHVGADVHEHVDERQPELLLDAPRRRDTVRGCMDGEKRLNFNIMLNKLERVSLVEFRRDARSVIRKVAKGKRLVLTVHNRPVMRLEPISEQQPMVGDDPFYALDRIAAEKLQGLTNEEIDKLVYEK